MEGEREGGGGGGEATTHTHTHTQTQRQRNCVDLTGKKVKQYSNTFQFSGGTT